MLVRWHRIFSLIVAMSAAALPPASGCAASDTADGAGKKLIFGVGLVVGLPGTGDALVDHAFVEQSIVGVLRRAGIDPWRGQIEAGRIAKVIVTAELPANTADGARVAVSVIAIGDATSLAGGMLLATPMRDPDGRLFALGQGQVQVGNQIAGAELSPQPEPAARGGMLAEGVVLDRDHGQEVAAE
jgi:flagellar P-ring protein precursor FlgI